MDYRGRGTVLLALHMTVIEDRSMKSYMKSAALKSILFINRAAIIIYKRAPEIRGKVVSNPISMFLGTYW